MTEVLLVMVAGIVGVTAQRIVGFGGGMFIAPVLLAYFDAPTTIMLTLFTGSLMSIILLYQDRRRLEYSWPIVSRIFAYAVPASLLGSYVVTQIDKAWLQVFLGVIIVGTTLVQEFVFPRPTKELKDPDSRIPVVGLTAGFLNATVAMAPLPVILWMRSHIVTPNQVRHNLALLFILINTVSMTTIGILKPATFNHDTYVLAALIVPLVLIGMELGRRIASKLKGTTYKKILFVMVLAAGSTTAVIGLLNLL